MGIDFSAVSPEQVIQHVAARTRELRLSLNYTQEEVGDLLGISQQQFRKYEQGKDRISVAYLYKLAQAFEVPIEYFYAGLPTTGSLDDANPSEKVRELVEAYYRIDDPAIRQELVAILRTLLPHDEVSEER